MTALEHLSLVIPVGRDDGRLARCLDELEAASLDGAEVLIVDNESRDERVPLSPGFERAARRFRVIRAVEPGKGAAVKEGMLHATRENRVFTDVDLPYGISGVLDVLGALDAGRAPVVVGSRLVPGSRAQLVRPAFIRRVLSMGFRAWVALCLGAGDLGDTQCGLKGFRADVARSLFEALGTPGFAFDCELLARARLAGHAVHAIPVSLRPEIGTSVHVVRDTLRMFRDVLRLRGVLAEARIAARGKP